MPLKRIIQIGLLIAAVALVYRLTAPLNSSAASHGSAAPDFALKTLTGDQEVKLSALKGKPVLLVFWASWCGPCMREIPSLKELHQEFGPTLEMVSVATADDNPDNTRAAVAAHAINWTVVHDTDGVAQNAYGVTGIPFLALIDRQGRISHSWSGLTDENEIRKAIQAIL